ncbi:MAG: hypothetical protein WBL45_03590 [Solirubrobacterales bacterium]
MDRPSAGWLQPLLAAAVLALIVTPVAIAESNGAATSKAQPKRVLKQVKELKKLTVQLAKRVLALEAGRPGQAEVLTGSPSGPAGGDLVGEYPGPELRTDTVFSENIVNNAILGTDIFNGTIQSADIAAEAVRDAQIAEGSVASTDITDRSVSQLDLGIPSVGGGQLVGVFVTMDAETMDTGTSGGATATCPDDSRLLSGGAEWELTGGGQFITRSAPTANDAWDAAGHNASGQTRTLIAKALCLRG